MRLSLNKVLGIWIQGRSGGTGEGPGKDRGRTGEGPRVEVGLVRSGGTKRYGRFQGGAKVTEAGGCNVVTFYFLFFLKVETK
jgi:hypothetical protein